MDGLAQLEYAHRTVPGLQGPGVNLTYRWVTRHTASCPLAGVVGCVLSSCVPGLAEPGSRRLGVKGENKWISFWGLVLLLSSLVSVLLVNTWIHIRRGHRHSGRRPSHLAVHFPSRGRARWVGDVANLARVCLFISLLFLFGRKNFTLFLHIRWAHLTGHYGGKAG